MVVATRSPDDISHRIDRFIEAQVRALSILSINKKVSKNSDNN
jgi:hypothetical protein